MSGQPHERDTDGTVRQAAATQLFTLMTACIEDGRTHLADLMVPLIGAVSTMPLSDALLLGYADLLDPRPAEHSPTGWELACYDRGGGFIGAVTAWVEPNGGSR